MDFNSIIRSAYSWVSIRKVIWFIAFFWISLPFIIVLPQLFESGAVYSKITMPIAILLYDVLYIALIFGIILLIQRCLAEKHEKVVTLNLRKIIDMIFLVFVELFYVFVWNINARLRRIQILLVISSALLGYLFLLTINTIVLVLFAWSLLGYFSLVIRNCIMAFFTTSIYINKNPPGLKDAVKESWAMTHNKVADTFSSIIVSAFLAFVLFAFITLALGAVSSIILRFFFIDSIALSLGFKVSMAFGLGVALIAYHFMIADVYSQLDRHRATSTGIKRLLAHRVLHPAKRKSKARKVAKRKHRRGR